MNQRLSLFAQAARRLTRTAPRRQLYTDPIYPYPHKYFNEYKFPSMQFYRENWRIPVWFESSMTTGLWMQRIFWTYISWSFFHDPKAFFGHHHFPDPSEWTDEELGIPPLEAGSYHAAGKSKD